MPKLTMFYVIFYGASALLVVYLVRRLIRKRRAAQGVPTPPPSARRWWPMLKPRVAAATVSTTETPKPVGSSSSKSPEPAPVPQPAMPVPQPAMPVPQAAARAESNRPIFQGIGRRDPAVPQLPVVHAADTPLADGRDYVFGGVTPLLASLLPESDARRADVRRELQNAGYYQPHAVQNLAAVRYLCILLPLVVLGLLLLIVPPRLEKYIVGGVIVLPLLGWSIPRLIVRSRAAERTSQIERAMPDMLDMLNMCVSQGMTVPTALKRVCQELPQVHPALYKELQIVSEQAHIGSLSHALENLSRRIDVPEVHSFTSLITQTERMGTSVSQALAEYSDNIRASLKQRADEKGNQAAFKLLFPTVLCLMPAVYLFLLGPSIIEVTKFFNREDPNRARVGQIIQGTGQSGNRGANR